MVLESLLPPVLRLTGQMLGVRGCLFTFHRAASAALWDRLPNRDFYLNLAFLDTLLTYLKETGWDIVTLDEAIARAASPKPTRRFVNFSVDDCYRDTFEEVVPLFRAHQAPVTLFVTTGIPDGTMSLWQAGLEDVLLNHGSVILSSGTLALETNEQKRLAFENLSRLWDGPQADQCYIDFCALNQIDAEALRQKHAISWDMLAQLKNDPSVEMGGHTVSHPRISSLNASEANAELLNCRLRLEEKLGQPVRHFAFPYGRSGDCGQRDFEIAAKAGYASAATTRKGLVFANQDASRLPRITLNGKHQNLNLVSAHLMGLTAVAAKALGRV